jgi:hypothetical protein
MFACCRKAPPDASLSSPQLVLRVRDDGVPVPLPPSAPPAPAPSWNQYPNGSTASSGQAASWPQQSTAVTHLSPGPSSHATSVGTVSSVVSSSSVSFASPHPHPHHRTRHSVIVGGGRYQYYREETIGQGQFGAVHACEIAPDAPGPLPALGPDDHLCIKMVRLHSPQERKKSDKEFALLRSVGHEHIVKVYDIFTDEGDENEEVSAIFIVLERAVWSKDGSNPCP